MPNKEITHIEKTDSLSKTQLIVNTNFWCAVSLRETCQN